VNGSARDTSLLAVDSTGGLSVGYRQEKGVDFKYQIPDSRFQIPDSRFQQFPESRTWNLESLRFRQIVNRESVIVNLESGISTWRT
jgi:hypothetical protein